MTTITPTAPHRGRSILRSTAGLFAISLLAAGLMCAPASAQNSDDDDDDLSGGALAVLLLGVGGAINKPPHWHHGNFRVVPGRAIPRLYNPGLRPHATARFMQGPVMLGSGIGVGRARWAATQTGGPMPAHPMIRVSSGGARTPPMGWRSGSPRVRMGRR